MSLERTTYAIYAWYKWAIYIYTYINVHHLLTNWGRWWFKSNISEQNTIFKWYLLHPIPMLPMPSPYKMRQYAAPQTIRWLLKPNLLKHSTVQYRYFADICLLENLHKHLTICRMGEIWRVCFVLLHSLNSVITLTCYIQCCLSLHCDIWRSDCVYFRRKTRTISIKKCLTKFWVTA